MRKTFVLLPAAALACACFAGCGGEASPVDVVRDFMQSLVKGDYERAYGLLSEESRDAIPYEEFREEMGKGVPDNLEGVEFELLQQTSDRAGVGISFPYGEGGEISLVKEGGAWRIDLADAYAEASARTCKANMRTVITQSNVYAAANDGVYPGSLDDLEGYLEDTEITCPSGGTIHWNFNPGPDGGPPEPECSIHGSP